MKRNHDVLVHFVGFILKGNKKRLPSICITKRKHSRKFVSISKQLIETLAYGSGLHKRRYSLKPHLVFNLRQFIYM